MKAGWPGEGRVDYDFADGPALIEARGTYFHLLTGLDVQQEVSLRAVADGASLWVRNRVDLIVSAVAPDPEGGALVCGHALTDPTGNQRLLLWRLDNMGRDVSLCELDGSRRDVCTDLLWTGEDYLVTARTTSPEYGAGDDTTHGRVIRTDALCQVRWQTGLGGSLNDSIEWAASMPDGGFILSLIEALQVSNRPERSS